VTIIFYPGSTAKFAGPAPSAVAVPLPGLRPKSKAFLPTRNGFVPAQNAGAADQNDAGTTHEAMMPPTMLLPHNKRRLRTTTMLGRTRTVAFFQLALHRFRLEKLR
jgi:hypothetical protein